MIYYNFYLSKFREGVRKKPSVETKYNNFIS